ncbi:oligosaccharide flippase family protein [Mycoplasmatota bacterium]|nr:oligosaccharide flippase family protein [Mycoplasmatota bacterium]
MKSKLMKGALFVTIATFFVKILSIVYKIPYQNLTGDKGFYIYQQMYPLFALVVATSSFANPLAISETITQKKMMEKTISSSLFFIFSISLLLSLVIVILNPYLGFIMGDRNLSSLFYPLIPVLLIVPIISIVRGYFYSNVHTINQVGISIISEQLFRVLFIIFILYLYYNVIIIDLYQVAKYSFYGFSIGLFMALVIVLHKFNIKLIHIRYVNLQVGLKIIKRSLFLLISASLLLFLQLIDSLTITKQLTHIMSLQEAMVVKGIYDRGLPIIQSAIFFVSPLLSSIIPHIQKKDFSKLILFILYLSLPAMIGLIFVLKDLNVLLFNDGKYTYVLQVSAIIVLLYSLFLTFSAITKDHKRLTIIIILGLVIKTSGNLILIDEMGIVGASLSSVASVLFMLVFIIILNREFIQVQYQLLFKIMTSCGVMSGVLLLSIFIPSLNHLFIKILLGISSYFGASYILKIEKSDFMIKYTSDA